MNLAQAARQNHAFIIYFHCIISFSLEMTAFSQESPMLFFFFFLGKTWQRGGKKCWAFPGSEEIFWVLLFSLQIYIHVHWHMLPLCAGRELWPPESNGPASVQSGEVKRYLRTWNGEIRTESYPRKCRSVGYIIIVAFIYLSHRWSSFSGLKWKWHVGKELHSIIQAFSLFWGIFPLIWGTYDNLVQPLAWVLLAGPLQQEHDVRSSVPSGWLSQSNFDFLKIESGISENCVQCSNRPRKPVLSFTVELELLVRDHG